MKKALIIGSTGMVGAELTRQLLEDNNYGEIVSFVRRASGVSHPKLTEHIVDFDKPESWKELVKGDVLFSALGTTIANAKTKDNQYKVDFTYQYETARMASENGVPAYVLVSSAGASSRAVAFYISMKGELEDAVKKLPFQYLYIFRPGQLDGDRKENRSGERIALKFMYFTNKLGIARRYHPIHAAQLAKAMITAAGTASSGIYTLDEIFRLK
ncbi:MAG: Semialdehyde dehydrogenase - binding protein [Bacteroidetes bacterium]|nr:Semialdehyde dehydrogenase - binding protein [Bacteroidota bacterium]